MSDTMQVHKLEVLVVDTDRLGIDSVIQELEHGRFGNRCITPRVMGSETREVDWNDGAHPINRIDMVDDAYAELFKRPVPAQEGE